MRTHDFATIVTSGADGPMASHVPVVLDAGRGGFGTLQLHVANANPHARELADAGSVLAIFHGQHGYSSPTWYANPISVPTWNYIVVHAYGRARQMDDEHLRAHLVTLTKTYEPERWSPDRLPADVFDKLRRTITGYEIEISRIEGKWKLGQNRTHEDRVGAIAGLRASGHHELAELMQAPLNPSAQTRCD